MIDLVVVSSDLRPHVLDTRVKRGAELSTDHHLVVSWIRLRRRMPDRLGRPKRIVRVCWERLADPSVRGVFNSHLREGFNQIPREVGDIESEWTMFFSSIVDSAIRSCGRLWSLVLVAAAIPEHSGGHWNGDGELLASTGDIVGQWKEYFEDLLNPTGTPSVEEPEAEDSEVDSFITQAEVIEVVQQLLGGKAPGVDEIRPEYLKSLDVVGLSWLTHLCNIAWRSGTVPLDWSTGVVTHLFKKGDRRVCSNYRGITLFSLPGKVYSRVLERRVRLLVEPRIQEEQCGFRPSRGTLDQLYTLHRVLKGSWEFAQPVHMCFVDLEKAFDRVPHGILWEVLWEYGVRGPLVRAVWSLYNRSRSLVRIASCKSDLFPVHVGLRQGCPLSPFLFIVFMDRISRHSQGLEGVRFGDHRISLLIFADDVLLAPSSLDLQHALGHFAAKCEAAGMRVSTSKSEAMVLDRKKVACTLQVGGEVHPQMEEFKYLGVLFTSEGRMDCEIDRRTGAAAAVMRSMYRSVVVKKELSQKAKLSIYQSIYVPTLTYGHELWVAEMSFLRRVVRHSLRDRVRSSVTWEELRVEPLLLHIERGQLRCLPGEVFWACPTRLGVPLEELEEVSGEREVTPDILKGQQELVGQPYEEVTKLALFNYLKEGVLQIKRERERSRTESKNLQQQLSDMHDVLDNTKSTDLKERDTLLQELANLRMEFQELQQMHEEQEDILGWKERELIAIKGALQEEVSAHAKEVETLKEEHEEENVAALAQKKRDVEAEQKKSHAQVQELGLAKEQLLGQVRSMETQITTLKNNIQQSKSQEKQLRERLDKLLEEKQRLEEEFSDVRQQEEDMCGANRALTRHLEDTQSELTKLNQEHRQLKERMKEEARQMEELHKSKKDLEHERKRQDRDFEKLQDELFGLEAELARREAELEKAEQRCEQLEMRVQELQECNRTAQDDRDRQVKLMEVRVAQLQDALTEERCSGDTLVQRMEKVKEQVEQVRADLLQERAVRQDLECDKISLERQNKDLKSRLSHLEVSQKSSQEGLVTKLELRIQELEERLHEQERDNNTLEQANRKLERKMKEITMQLNDEHLSLQNQMDQLTLRLKVLKRQLDEAEEEIERLESSKKKLQRELDDQQEINEQLQSQISALKTELRRKTKPVLKSLTEDEDDEQWNLSAKVLGGVSWDICAGAQTVLSRNTLGEPLTIHLGFTIGLVMGVYIAGGVSGGHLNPAVSLAMVILGKLKIWKFPVYVMAQLLGAFAGAAGVFGLYYDAFMEFTSGILSVTGINATGHIFASYPGRHLTILGGFVDQVIGTGMLVLCILAITDSKNIGAPKGVEPLGIGLIILGISVSMGMNCGYPLNPARDLGPRLFTAMAGWGMEVFSTADHWWWIPVFGPLIGGITGAVVYFLLIELHHTDPSEKSQQKPEEEEDEEEDEDSSLRDKYEMITMG
ncbi:hypothetical protein QTP86_009867 [Hemibagrus guttatus]|nr:hypothetical protein QTP86_009867 [Hemibagrus guttatus]